MTRHILVFPLLTNEVSLSQHLPFSKDISQLGFLHHLGYGDAAGDGQDYRDDSHENLGSVEGEEGMVKLGQHREDGVEEVDGERVPSYI